MNKIITISREFGSGGRTIAKMVAEKLNISVYDNELLIQLAEKSGFSKEYIEEKVENTSWNSLLSTSLSKLGSYSQLTAEDYLWKVQQEVIIDLAKKESCIIVGRCADFILREKADCLKIFIHADKKKRAERIVKVYGDESKETPEKRIKDKDKRRSAFYSYHTWGNPHNYHICLNSGELGFEKYVEIICSLYNNY